MPPEFDGICMGDDQRNHRFAPELTPGGGMAGGGTRQAADRDTLPGKGAPPLVKRQQSHSTIIFQGTATIKLSSRQDLSALAEANRPEHVAEIPVNDMCFYRRRWCRTSGRST